MLYTRQTQLHGLFCGCVLSNPPEEAHVLPGRTRVFILSSFIDVIYVIHPEFGGLDPLPARRQPLALERVAPVSRVRVMIYVVFPSSNSPVHRPAGRKR